MIAFIAANLPIILLFLTGIALLVLEAFMPGFGLPGISGIVVEVITLVLTWMQHGPLATLGMLLIVLSVLAIAISMSLRSITRGKLSQSKLINRETESTAAGYRTAEDLNVFLNREGQVTTTLRPTGMAEFDGVKLNVVSDGEYLPAGTRVRIVRVEGSRILVRTVG